MEAQDILTATHKLEGSGMTRSQSEAIAETIIAAVAPLATHKDLEAARADIVTLREETKAEFAKVRGESKADTVALKEQMATKTDIANINTNIESAKFRFSICFSGLIGALLVAAASNMYF